MINAALWGHKEIVELLLKNGANINVRGKNRKSPLSWAAYMGHTDVVKLLFNWNANPNLRDVTGGTLHTSAFFGYSEIVKLFLDNNADPNLKDDSNLTALDWARKRGNHDTYEILKESTQCYNTECGKCQDICLLCDGSKSIDCKGEEEDK